MNVCALIVAAGRGIRAGGDVPKQYQQLAGRAVLDWTIAAWAGHPSVAALVVVLHPDDRELFAAEVRRPETVPWMTVSGGSSRDASVRAGLAACPEGLGSVLIHDAARPLVGADLIGRVADAVAPGIGAAPALPVTDALWTGEGGRVTGTRDRAGLWRAQTPQGFRLADIRAAHAAWAARADAPPAADDVEVARAHGLDVRIVEGDEDNIKITGPGDVARAARLLAGRGDGVPASG